MQASAIDFVQRDSPLHRMDARWKLAAIALSIIPVVLLRTVGASTIALLGALLLLTAARLPFRWFLGRLAGVAFFLSLFLLLLPLTMPGDDLSLGPIGLSSDGLKIAVVVCLKALAVVALGLLVFATAPFETTLKAAHSLYVPSFVIQLLMLTYRHLYSLADELHKLRIALRLRNYRNRASVRSYRTIGHVTGTLLVRSYERAERVAQAMRCRGFAGEFRSIQTFAATPLDLIRFAAVLALVGLLPWLLEIGWGLV